ncbi:MAG: hypothetical protein O2816_10485 [Planctomycetota bacterium]|nr:hypothetical protein [Planctomycetota bacterium]
MLPIHALYLAALAAAAHPAEDPTPEVEPVTAQSDDDRLDELERKFAALAGDLEDYTLADVIPPVGEAQNGVGPAGSKVYRAAEGSLSIGGYGEAEMLFPDGGSNEFDLHRVVLYFGYKFDEKWVFNSEIEFEHADESFVEFAYLDYLHSDAVNFRGGLMLVPMGLVNAIHEPTTYLGATRPLTESYILPSTWREGGASIYGDLGGLDYQVAVVSGFDGGGFGGMSGLRGGRQKGSEALSDDMALIASLDYTDTPGLVLGGSLYSGDAGQGMVGGSLETSIFELHADYKSGPLWLRALIAEASVDDRDAGSMDLSGWYAEAGWDLLRDNEVKSLYPFIRYEEIDTDPSAGGVDERAITFGLHYRPIDQIVIKADYADYDNDLLADRFQITLGWVF